MRVIYDKLPSNKRESIATIGIFDGIHLGHQFILKKTAEEAKQNGFFSLVVAFDISPGEFFSKKPHRRRKPKKAFTGYIVDLEQRKALIKSLGIDYLWLLKTNQSLLKLSAEDFLLYIFRYFEIKKIIVGEDFRFGCAGEGNVKYLKEVSRKYNFELSVVRKRSVDREIVSSSIIREFIRKGEFKKIRKFLGRNFLLKGEVYRNRGLGTRIGFPTANLHTFDYVIPAEGVYSAYAILEKKVYLAAVNIGVKSTAFAGKGETLEAHIINFQGDLLGKIVKIVFLEKIRKEKKFSSLGELKNAIQKDIKFITSKYSTPLPKYPQPLVV